MEAYLGECRPSLGIVHVHHLSNTWRRSELRSLQWGSLVFGLIIFITPSSVRAPEDALEGSVGPTEAIVLAVSPFVALAAKKKAP